MSFSSDSKRDLALQPIRSKCCCRAMLSGLLMAAKLNENIVSVAFEAEEIAVLTATLVSDLFSKECEIARKVMYGREKFIVAFDSKPLRNLVKDYSKKEETVSSLVQFKCAQCRASFMKGVFLAVGTVNDPFKSLHAEFSFYDEERAEKLDAFLAEFGVPARKVIRENKIGLYYKKGDDIEDLFGRIGINNIVFMVADSKIQNEIRGNENRATNCVATNISRSVNATGKQIAAILKLKEHGKFEYLSDDLKITAELRLANDDISLSELAEMHVPPISKSGLNHRLSKLIEEAEKLK